VQGVPGAKHAVHHFLVERVVAHFGDDWHFAFIIIYYYFLTPVLNSQGMKKLRYAIQKSTKINLE